MVTLWDLRHAHSPEKILAGHQKGVMGVSWCRQDSDLLMSCGKDCRTLCWNPRTGEQLGELSHSSNWTFQADWCPRNPDLLATGSFDGKVCLYFYTYCMIDSNLLLHFLDHCVFYSRCW